MSHFPFVSLVFVAGGMREHNRNKQNHSQCVENGREAEATRTVQMRRKLSETVTLRETERNRRYFCDFASGQCHCILNSLIVEGSGYSMQNSICFNTLLEMGLLEIQSKHTTNRHSMINSYT